MADNVCYDGPDLGVYCVVYSTVDLGFVSAVLTAHDGSEAMRNAIVRMEFVPGAERVHSMKCVGTLYELLTCRRAIPLLRLHSWRELPAK